MLCHQALGGLCGGRPMKQRCQSNPLGFIEYVERSCGKEIEKMTKSLTR